MVRKGFKHDISESIIGMTFDDAKTYCLSESYQLIGRSQKTNLTETYVITVTEYDSDGKILKAKYGK
jgi:hypothetical protein